MRAVDEEGGCVGAKEGNNPQAEPSMALSSSSMAFFFVSVVVVVVVIVVVAAVASPPGLFFSDDGAEAIAFVAVLVAKPVLVPTSGSAPPFDFPSSSFLSTPEMPRAHSMAPFLPE